MTGPGPLNAEYVAEQYERWKAEPSAFSEAWSRFFEGFELGFGAPPGAQPCTQEDLARQACVEDLVYGYRDLGHLLSCLDPLEPCPVDHPLLRLEAFGLSGEDLDREFQVAHVLDGARLTLRSLVEHLRETYGRSVGVEYMHLQDPAERRWLQHRMEPIRNRPELSRAERLAAYEWLCRATLFEEFLHRRYLGQTRFSLEGAEAVIPALRALLARAVETGCTEAVLGMAHRGRLNVEAHVLEVPYEELFAEFEADHNPDGLAGGGDVKYHRGVLSDLTIAGRPLRLFLPDNPSHLEAVDPVVEGVARARQDRLRGPRDRVLPILLHGDAALAGQGIVLETMNLSQVEGYRTEGTVHLVINNQIGYTTMPSDARSTRYSTDVAKMLMVPIFHVHGEDPEAAVHMARLAFDYRLEFGKDVFLDVVCFRRYGHNEGDEPYFTQPQMYERIRQRPPLHRLYGEHLEQSAVATAEELETVRARIGLELEEAHARAKQRHPSSLLVRHYEDWEGLTGPYSDDPVDTAVPAERLGELSRAANRVPEGFSVHPKLARLLERRQLAVDEGRGLDWANAEALAFASLVAGGVPVRLTGEDTRRGTFSQRHSVWVDGSTCAHWTPLAAVASGQAPFYVFDSTLSEAGVLGFEYGYSLASPASLVLWEAQYGDFANSAQVVIDQFIASGEAKWQRPSGIVLLLPHGYEGQGPDHSSARLERWLQLCARRNLQVCQPTTPAQYFHLLRRQALRHFRKPLIVLTPKSLLRHPRAVSALSALSSGAFEPVLDDPAAPRAPARVLLASGKIYYELLEAREAGAGPPVALHRVEQLYPVPERGLSALAERHGPGAEWVWVQEEPENMGAWSFLRPYLDAAADRPVRLVARPAEASPATGFLSIHKEEQRQLLERALAPAA